MEALPLDDFMNLVCQHVQAMCASKDASLNHASFVGKQGRRRGRRHPPVPDPSLPGNVLERHVLWLVCGFSDILISIVGPRSAIEEQHLIGAHERPVAVQTGFPV